MNYNKWCMLILALVLCAGCTGPSANPTMSVHPTAITQPAVNVATIPVQKTSPTAIYTFTEPAPATAEPYVEIAEVAVKENPLSGPASKSNAEFSGLGWHGNMLVLLPQYPDRFEGGPDGALFGIQRDILEACARGEQTGPIEPSPIPFDAGDIQSQIPGFEGYEAIAFLDDQVFLGIEARRGKDMTGFLVSGRFDPSRQAIKLDPTSLTENPLQVNVDNQADEALLVSDGKLYSFYELYGAALNPDPHVTTFAPDLTRLGILPFPAIEYRLTDAAGPDEQGQFWVINYFFPGDENLKPDRDPLSETYGKGPSHASSEIVERLVEFQLTPGGVERTNTPPVQLVLRADGEARNWEGLAILPGFGFFLVTDKFPNTILGFVSYP